MIKTCVQVRRIRERERGGQISLGLECELGSKERKRQNERTNKQVKQSFLGGL